MLKSIAALVMNFLLRAVGAIESYIVDVASFYLPIVVDNRSAGTMDPKLYKVIAALKSCNAA